MDCTPRQFLVDDDGVGLHALNMRDNIQTEVVEPHTYNTYGNHARHSHSSGIMGHILDWRQVVTDIL